MDFINIRRMLTKYNIILLIIAILLNFDVIIAQGNCEFLLPAPITGFQNSPITSTFGPRRDNPYHHGIDYKMGLNRPVFPILPDDDVQGTITDIRRISNNNYNNLVQVFVGFPLNSTTNIVIEYWHLFPYSTVPLATAIETDDTETEGGSWAIVRTNPQQTTSAWAIIHYSEDEEGNKIVDYALCKETTEFTAPNGELVSPLSTVSANVAIGPCGNSGKSYYPVHLHIALTENGIYKNPLKYISHDCGGLEFDNNLTLPQKGSSIYHTSDHSYEYIRLCVISDNNCLINTNTPPCGLGAMDFNSLKIFLFRDDMVASVNNINTIIQDDNVINAHRLNGNNSKSKDGSYKAEFNFGGLLGEGTPNSNVVFPSFIENDDIPPSPNDIHRTRVSPMESSGGGVDTFYYYNLNTRVFPNYEEQNGKLKTAVLNNGAKYKDGPYRLVAYAEDVNKNNDHAALSATDHNITIDNFLPYLKHVIATQNGSPVYEAKWEYRSQSEELVKVPENLEDRWKKGIDANSNLHFELTFSEQVEYNNIIFKIDNLTVLGYVTEVIGDTIWVVDLPPAVVSSFPNNSPFKLKLDVKDYAGNRLFDFRGKLKLDNSEINLLSRNVTSGSMVGTNQCGADTIHSLRNPYHMVKFTSQQGHFSVAPVRSKKIVVTLENIGTEKIEDVGGSATVSINPSNLITVINITPSGVTIDPGTTQDFEIEYEVGCPPQNAQGKHEAAEFKFTISALPNKRYYAPDLAPDNIYPPSPGGQPTPIWKAPFSIKLAQLFDVICLPPWQSIRNGQTKSHAINIYNLHPENDEQFDIAITGGGNGWTINPTNFTNIDIPVGGMKCCTLHVTNSNANVGSNILVEVTEKECLIKKTPSNLVNAQSPGHIMDHPDDNYSVSSPEYPTPWFYDSKSIVGVLSNGWGEGILHLIGKFNISAAVVSEDLTILNEPERSINDLDVLIIGSAGLDGLESSLSFRDKLDEYVKEGGSLVCLTAKNGYEFAALPGGEVAGYGWNEDQSCLNAAVSMVKYHQILSGQTSTDLTVNVDGYFTKNPSNAVTLLQRNKNGMPALIMYRYGKGTVIATTIFEDWAYGNNQSTDAGQKLIRDIVTWSQLADSLPEFSIGEAINFPLTIHNSTNYASEKVAITTYNSFREITKKDTFTITILPNDSNTIQYSYETGQDSLGIWPLEHSLLTSENEIIQTNKISNMFVVSDPAGVAEKKDVTVDITSDDEYYPRGGSVNFIIHLRNNTNNDTLINTKYYWVHKPVVPKIDTTIFLPGNSTESFSRTLPYLNHCGRFECTISNSLGEYIDWARKGIWTYSPLVSTDVKTNKNRYIAGDTLKIDVGLKNNTLRPCSTNVLITIKCQSNEVVYNSEYNPLFISENVSFKDSIFIIPDSLRKGVYSIKVVLQNNGNVIGSGYNNFMIIDEYNINIVSILPPFIQEGMNNFSFIINSEDMDQKINGGIRMSLINPHGDVIWEDSNEVEFSNNEKPEILKVIPISNIEFGKYILSYNAYYKGHNNKEFKKGVLSASVISESLDKGNYKIRENVNIGISISNIGWFKYSDALCSVILPGIDSCNDEVEIDPNKNIKLNFSLNLPENITAGEHNGIIILKLKSGSYISKTFSVVIPQKRILLKMDSLYYVAGDTIRFELHNIGCVDAIGKYKVDIKDNNNRIVSSQENEMKLFAGTSEVYKVVLPFELATGEYKLDVWAYDELTYDTDYFIRYLKVNGGTYNLNVKTDKRCYESINNVIAEAAMQNPLEKDKSGSLQLCMYKKAAMEHKIDTNSIKHNSSRVGISSLSAGGYFNIILNDNGKVVLWGSSGISTVPLNLSNVVKIASGFNHTAAILENGTVVAWGRMQNDYYGKCNVPSGLNNVKMVATGMNHTVALTEGGFVNAWGDNSYGQCDIPDEITNVKYISAGANHTILVKDDGLLIAIGDNRYGQCNVPQEISSVKKIVAGLNHTVVIENDGNIVAWGDNSYGQCDVPENMTSIESIAAGYNHTIYLKSNGNVLCKGENDLGQCTVPKEVYGVVQIAAGEKHSICLKNNGELIAWGYNYFGQCNNYFDTTEIVDIASKNRGVVTLNANGNVTVWGTDCNVPPDIKNITAIAAGDNFHLALNGNGTVFAWGDNTWGQCDIPEEVENIKYIAAGDDFAIAVNQDGNVFAWGQNHSGQCNIPEGLTNVTKISASSHVLAIKEDSTVVAWGFNNYNQCNVPNSLGKVIAVSAGSYFSIALNTDGNIEKWGSCYWGQCYPYPNVKELAAGARHTAVLTKDGKVVSWGENQYGYAQPTVGDSNVIKISSRGSTVSILKENGCVVTWQTILNDLYANKSYPKNSMDKNTGISFVCIAENTATWDSLCFDQTIPDSLNIEFFTRTADEYSNLYNSPWVVADRPNKISSKQISSKVIEVQLKPKDDSHQLQISDLPEMSMHYSMINEIWGDTIELMSIDTTVIIAEINANVDTGLYTLKGNLKNNFHQIMVSDEYDFMISNKRIAITIDSDKKVYKPRETITFNITLHNNSNDVINEGELEIKVNGNIISNDYVTVPSNDYYMFNSTIIAPDSNVIVECNFEEQRISKMIEVQKPYVAIELEAPEYCGREPFDFLVKIENQQKVKADIAVAIEGEEKNVSILPGRYEVIKTKMSLNETSMVNVRFAGDIDTLCQKIVKFGEEISVEINNEKIYQEGIITIPYVVTNEGKLDVNEILTFNIGGTGISKDVFIPVGASITGDIVLNQKAGKYLISYSSFFGTGSSEYYVAKTDQIDIKQEVKSDSMFKVLVLRDDNSDKYLIPVLEENGIKVVQSDLQYPYWDGSNQDVNNYNVVILPHSGISALGENGEKAILNYVNNGGGFITTEWITYSKYMYEGGAYNLMNDILLFKSDQFYPTAGQQDFVKDGVHPITEGLPEIFSVDATINGIKGPIKEDATNVLSGTIFNNAIAVKQYNKGRIVQFAVEALSLFEILGKDENWKKLIVNSVNWAGRNLEEKTVTAMITVKNNGCNTFNGQLSTVTDFFVKKEDLIIAPEEEMTFSYDMDISSVVAGEYKIKNSIHNSEKLVSQKETSFTIYGPKIELTTIPVNNNFLPNEEINLIFGISNIGKTEGKAEIGFKCNELFEDTRISWIAPGIEKLESFAFQIPDDYPDGEYKAEIYVNGMVTEIPFTVSGVKLAVVATLDKPFYEYGDFATLSLEVNNESSLFPEVYALAKANNHEDRKDFTLSETQTISLLLPVSEQTPKRIAYGIYMASGRAIHLNTTYIRIKEGTVFLYTDKPHYNVGDEVTVNVATEETGELSVLTTTGYTDVLTVNGDMNFTFSLPEDMVSGTQTIDYTLNGYKGECNFDVFGITARIIEVTFNKELYNPVDTLAVEMKIHSNTPLLAIIKGWLFSPEGSYSDFFEVTRDLNEGETSFSVVTPFEATIGGTHKLIYGVYTSGTNLNLVSGSKSFDVKPAAILSVNNDKEAFNEGEGIGCTVKTYACGTFSGIIEILENGNVLASQEVTLSGYSEQHFDLGIYETGNFQFLARLKNNEEIISECEFQVPVIDMNAPAVPTGVTLEIDGAVASITWNENTESDLQGYNIFSNGAKLNILPISTASYREEAIVPGFEYSFTVTAIDYSGNESNPSLPATTILDNKAPEISMSPSSSQISSQDVTVTYDVSDNIDENPYVTASYPSPTTFTDDGIYQVTVSAVDAQGNKATKSIDIIIESGPPVPVENLIAQDMGSNGAIILSWQDYQAPADLADFRIFVNEEAFSSAEGLSEHAIISGSDRSYTVTELTNGQQYSFGVVPVDTRDNFNPAVTSVSAIPTQGTGAISVTSLPEGTNVYLGGNYGFPGEFKGNAPLTITDLSKGNYIVQMTHPGYSKYYRMVTVNSGQTENVDAAMQEKVSIALSEGEIIQLLGSDLNTGGYSAPFVVDWDMDGKKDLISPNGSGTISLFMNSGTDDNPQFTEEAIIVDQLSSVSVFPVDWNNDQKKDLVLGNQAGELYILLNIGTDIQPEFAEPERIGTITVGGAAIPAIYDWNNDGKKDLIVGASTGEISLYLNNGTDQEPQFQNDADEILTTLEGGEAAPFIVYDWNTDGIQDLVVGSVTGHVSVYLATGTQENPVLEQNGTRILEQAVDGYSRPFVLDYNNDGKEDLLVGSVNGEIALFKGMQILPAPTGVAARAKSGKVGIDWDAVERADSYVVYRKDLGETPIETVQYCACMDYNVTNGITYTYTIAAIDENGNIGSKSAEVSATPVARQRR